MRNFNEFKASEFSAFATKLREISDTKVVHMFD